MRALLTVLAFVLLRHACPRGQGQAADGQEDRSVAVEHLATLPAPAGVSANFKTYGKGKAKKTYMFVSALSGIYVYDVTDGASPQPAGALPLPHFQNEDVSIGGDKLLSRRTAQTGSYLVVIDISNPTTPTIEPRHQDGDPRRGSYGHLHRRGLPLGLGRRRPAHAGHYRARPRQGGPGGRGRRRCRASSDSGCPATTPAVVVGDITRLRGVRRSHARRARRRRPASRGSPARRGRSASTCTGYGQSGDPLNPPVVRSRPATRRAAMATRSTTRLLTGRGAGSRERQGHRQRLHPPQRPAA